MTFRAAIYARQSHDVQEGIERQIAKCTDLVNLSEWDLVEVFEDNDTSASKRRGPETAWAKMLNAFDENVFEVLVAVNLDRLLRSQRDLTSLIERGILIRTVEGEIDLTSAFGEFQISIATSIAAFEVRRKAERQKRANDFRARKGFPPASKRVFGWEKDQITIRPAEARTIRLAFKLLLEGNSLHEICRILNRRGLATISGKTWGPNQLKVMMLRERNCGRLVRNGEVMPVSKIAPIVSAEDYDTVRAILTDPNRGSSRGPKPEKNWLTGIMKCGGCDSPMWTKNVSSKKYKARNYVCSNTLKRTTPREHGHCSVLAEVAEGKVLMYLYGHFSSEPVNKKSSNIGPRLKKLEKELKKWSDVRNAAQELYLNVKANRATLVKQIEHAADNIERLMKERSNLLGETNEAVVLARKIAKAGDSGETAQEWLRVWSEFPLETRRNIIRSNFDITVRKGGKGAKRVEVAVKSLP